MESEYTCPYCGGMGLAWRNNGYVCQNCSNPAEELMPDLTGGMPGKLVGKGFEKAPNTITGLAAGGIFGAIIAGPPGALIGGVIGGILGLDKDENGR